MPEHTSDELTESEEQYRLLDTSGEPETSAEHLPFPTPTMGSDSANKSEERRGDKLAAYGALVRACPRVLFRHLHSFLRHDRLPCW